MEQKKVTALSVVSGNLETMVDVLLEQMETATGKWEKGWHCENEFRNYVSQKSYSDSGINCFMLTLSAMLNPKILGMRRSHCYVTMNQAMKMKWKLKDSAKEYTRLSKETRQKLQEKLLEWSTEKDETKKELLLAETRKLQKEYCKYKIWNEILFWNISYFQLVKKDGQWIKQILERNDDVYTVIKEQKVNEDYVKANSRAINKVASLVTTKYYNVAAIEFFDGDYDHDSLIKEKPIVSHEQPCWQILQDYFDREKISCSYEPQNRAYYNVTFDNIVLPISFKNEGEEIATCAHEACHSTGYKSRLNRFKDGANSQSEYSKEELVAEFGSMFFMMRNNCLTDELLNQTLLYCKGYLKYISSNTLENNVISGINGALKAVNFIYETKKEGL